MSENNDPRLQPTEPSRIADVGYDARKHKKKRSKSVPKPIEVVRITPSPVLERQFSPEIIYSPPVPKFESRRTILLSPTEINYDFSRTKSIATIRSVKPSVVSQAPVQVEQPSNWFLKNEVGPFKNIVYVAIIATIGTSLLICSGLVMAKYIRQENANLNAATLQTAKFVGEKCNGTKDCANDGICLSNFCQCAPDRYYDTSIGKCLTYKTYGSSCLENRECNIYQHLICSSNLVCTCPIQTIYANYYGSMDCVRTREVGEICYQTSDCIPTAECVSSSGTLRCLCPSGKFISFYTGRCEYARTVYERCYTFYEECPSFTTCRTYNNGDGTTYCLCVTGTYYEPSLQTCTYLKNYGDACSNTTQCNTFYGIQCLYSKCQCDNTTQFWNGTFCSPYRTYGQPCSTSLYKCNPYDSNLACGVPPSGVTTYMCYCPTNFYYDEYSQLCTYLKTQGLQCYSSYECIDNATCSGYVCVCYPGFWYNNSTGQCEPKLVYGDSCTAITGKPCSYEYYGLGCYTGVCQCDPSYEYWTGTGCDRLRHYSEACSSSVPCRTYRGFTCSSATSGSCTCQSGKGWNSFYEYCY